MEANIIARFYTCFSNKDYKGMQACYSDDAIFSDPVFGLLNASEVRAMWEMLLQRAPDLMITFNSVTANARKGTAEWVARYTFSATGKKVVNRVHADFILKDGLILKHTDNFTFYAWAKQSLGLTGFLFGKTNFLNNKISKQARKNLTAYMQKHK